MNKPFATWNEPKCGRRKFLVPPAKPGKRIVRFLVLAYLATSASASFGQANSVLLDPNLDRVVRATLHKSEGDLAASDLLLLTNLYAANWAIANLTGLEFADHLQALRLPQNNITNIAPLANLPELRVLDISSNPVQDYNPLMSIPKLASLDLTFSRLKEVGAAGNIPSLTNLVLALNHISDFSTLRRLTNLVALDLGENIVTDYTPLLALGRLRDLGLRHTGISNAASLLGFTNLCRLDVSRNSISDPAPLLNLLSLKELDLGYNPLAAPSTLSQFTNLSSLIAGQTGVTNLASLAGLRNLVSLEVWENGVTDLSPLAGLTNLVHLDVSATRITNFVRLAGLTRLEDLRADFSMVSDLGFARDLPGLKGLALSYNLLTDLAALAGLTNLTRLEASFNVLTNLNSIDRLPQLSLVAVNGNLLDLENGSESLQVIQTLTNRGSTVYFEPQARVPTIFVHTNWFIAAGQRTSIPFMLDCDFSPIEGPACAARSSDQSLIPDANLALNALPGFYWWNLSVTPLKDQAGLLTLALSATNHAGLRTNAVIQVEVVRSVPFDGRDLDAQRLAWTTAGNPAWLSQTTTSHDGSGAAQSGAANSFLQTRVTGPGLLSFWWLLALTTPDYGQFVVTSPEGTNVASEFLYPAGDWSEGRFRLPAGEWILQWRASYQDYWYYYGGSNTLWIDEVTFIPGEPPCRLEPAPEWDHSPDGSFWVDFEGAVDQTYDIEVSEDLQRWSNLTQATCFGFHGQFSDWNSGAAARFYRAKPHR